MEDATTPTQGTSRTWWRLPVLLAIVLAAIVLVRARGLEETASENEPTPRARAANGEQVSLAIDFGDDRKEQNDAVSWHNGMTVRDLMSAAGTQPESRIKFAQQGSGATAFLTQINGVANEGAGGRNWTYQVNGKLGDRSFAIYELRPGDKVLWTFATQQ